MSKSREQTASLLQSQLLWFIRLRYAAGAAVSGFALLNVVALHWYERDLAIFAVGLAILLYNQLMIRAMNRLGRSPYRVLSAIAWAQILFDLACLTCLAAWTGGIQSPLMGFYVFHMIFASLLLPRRRAYAGALISIAMVAASLWFAHDWPRWRDGTAQLALGWAASLLLTVHLSNHITRAVRRQRHRLIKQNLHIRRIGRKMKRQQETLIRQEKMAALGQMAAGIAHEIGNPLASLDSLVQLLQRKPERVSEQSLASLRTQVSRITQIVREMGNFAHPDAGHWEVVEVNEVVDSALDMLKFDPRIHSVQVVRDLSPATGATRMMPQATRQVLVNLIINALDAMAQTPQPRLEIRTSRQAQWCVIQVIDNGHGIPPENLQRIFEPFFTTKPLGKGTGVGLSLSYSMIRQQGGAIQVQSQPGGGTTFDIRLPAKAIAPRV